MEVAWTQKLLFLLKLVWVGFCHLWCQLYPNRSQSCLSTTKIQCRRLPARKSPPGQRVTELMLSHEASCQLGSCPSCSWQCIFFYLEPEIQDHFQGDKPCDEGYQGNSEQELKETMLERNEAKQTSPPSLESWLRPVLDTRGNLKGAHLQPAEWRKKKTRRMKFQWKMFFYILSIWQITSYQKVI